MHPLGPPMIFLFCVSQALRDVYLGSVFQGVGVFAVILLAFSISTVVFGGIVLYRRPDDLKAMWAMRSTASAMIVATAVAWPCYFFALTHVEPSIVNTIHSGAGLLLTAGLAGLGSGLTGRGDFHLAQHACNVGVALSLFGLGWIVLAGFSGVRSASLVVQLAALLAVMLSGTAITMSLLYAKRLHNAGVSSEGVTFARYSLLIFVALWVELSRAAPPDHLNSGNLATLAVATTLLMVLPLFALQVGIEHTHPITSHIIRALGPALIFGFQQFDQRIGYSVPTLMLIAMYSLFAIAGSVLELHRKRGVASR